MPQTNPTAASAQRPPLPDLEHRNSETGELYVRPGEVEEAIYAALEMPMSTVIARARTNRRAAPGYIRSEVLVHLIRRTKKNNQDQTFAALFEILIDRVEATCRGRRTRTSEGKLATDFSSDRIRELVVDGITALILKDRQTYQPQLDFLEVRFDQHIWRRRSDAKKKIARKESRTESIVSPEIDAAASERVEAALAKYAPGGIEREDDLISRIDFARAITLLPEKEQTVFLLHKEQIPMESNNPKTLSITKYMGCDRKTARKYLAQARARLVERLDLKAQS